MRRPDTRSTGAGAKNVSKQEEWSKFIGKWIMEKIGCLVCLDYFDMSEEEGAKPNLVAVDRDTGMVMATAINQKKMGDLTAQKALTRFLEILGYREVVLKSDGERSLVKMKMEAAKQARGVSRAVPEESPQGDARANGQAEVAVKEVKWRIRAILLTLAKKFQGGVP